MLLVTIRRSLRLLETSELDACFVRYPLTPLLFRKSEGINDLALDMELAPLPASERIKMNILRNGKPVTAVSLGEEVELRWTIDERARKGPDDELLGFLVEDCTAERMDGQPPDPPPLPLIVGGYSIEFF